MIFAAVLAGGTGSRMNTATIPKQFLPLGDKPILIHSLEKFVKINEFEMIYLAVHPDWIEYSNDLLAKHFTSEEINKVKVVLGGNDRNSSILNVITFSKDKIPSL